MSDQRLKIAVFIDFDNVEIGVKTTLGLQFDVGAVLEAIKERGEIITKVAYGDWKRAGDHGRAMAQHAVRLVQRVMTPGGDKNGADINLALDALEMAFTHDHINAFVIVGGDSDFITLVEKLKQYDKKVFVVGGRSFTSQVMQKNCTEFIAYENVAGSGPRHSGGVRPERGRPGGAASIEQVLTLVKRALKVLTDREVSPQLGLLKSTLLQLDSSFSERDYGASTFRDFAEKLEQRGLVTLKHSGRTTIVELSDTAPDVSASITPTSAAAGNGAGADGESVGESIADGGDGSGSTMLPAGSYAAAEPLLSLADGVALVRAVLAESATPPRWPMYLRQMKQFIRAARPDFDERRYGSLPDLLRACQKDGLLRLERDRQGGLRAFAGSYRPSNVPHGWGTLAGPEGAPPQEDVEAEVIAVTAAPVDSEPVAPQAEPEELVAAATPIDEEPPPPAVDEPEDDQLAIFGAVAPGDPEPAAVRRKRGTKAGGADGDRPRRGRKTGAAKTEGSPRAPRGGRRGDDARLPRGRGRQRS
jgi:uncharacterized LabA/DUF88 family protein